MFPSLIRQKETPAEGRGSKNASQSVTLFPPCEAFFPHEQKLTHQLALCQSCRPTPLQVPRPSLEICVADGDAPPERFDHASTLLPEQVPRDTHQDFLRKRGLDRSRNRGQITTLVRHRSAGLPSPISDSAKSLSGQETTIQVLQATFSRHPQIPSESGDGTGYSCIALNS